MSQWIDPRHADTMARFRGAQAAVPSTGCVPCAGTGKTSTAATCRPCVGTGKQKPARLFITT